MVIVIALSLIISVKDFINSRENYSYEVENDDFVFTVKSLKKYYLESEDVTVDYVIKYKGNNASKKITYSGALILSKVYSRSTSEWYIHDQPASYFTLDIGLKGNHRGKYIREYTPNMGYNESSKKEPRTFLSPDTYKVIATYKYFDVESEALISDLEESEEKLSIEYKFNVIDKRDLIKLSIKKIYNNLMLKIR